MSTDAAAVLDPVALALEILDLQGDMEDKGLDYTGYKDLYQQALSSQHRAQMLLSVRDAMRKRLQKHSETAAKTVSEVPAPPAGPTGRKRTLTHIMPSSSQNLPAPDRPVDAPAQDSNLIHAPPSKRAKKSRVSADSAVPAAAACLANMSDPDFTHAAFRDWAIQHIAQEAAQKQLGTRHITGSYLLRTYRATGGNVPDSIFVNGLRLKHLTAAGMARTAGSSQKAAVGFVQSAIPIADWCVAQLRQIPRDTRGQVRNGVASMTSTNLPYGQTLLVQF